MKLKFKADKKDVKYFIIFSIILFFLISLAVGNIRKYTSEGYFVGLNIFSGLTIGNIFYTVVLFLIVILGVGLAVSSYFFERTKGIGFEAKKEDSDGYSKWAKESDIKNARDVKVVNESDYSFSAAGVPLYSEKGQIWVDDGESHSLIIGATGSGKTYCVVNPLVHILAKKGESMIITDPKGEIYENNANFLRDRGYDILLLNFRNPQKGNCWNPLYLPYELYKKGNIDKSNELLRDLAVNILHDQKSDDPFWENTASDYFFALTEGLFQDADPKCININSVIQMLTTGEEKYGASTYSKEYFKSKSPTNPAYINAAGTIDAPNETKGSILSVFRSKVNIFAMAENLSEMLSKSDFDMNNIGRKKTAVFLIIQDEKTTYHPLTTIFVKQCYESLIDVAQENGGKLPVRTNFILDEFANMPELKDVTTMITAARSRQIRFNLIIQNFAQLSQVYGKENAETIKGNCGNMIYLLSSELNALEEISKLCGDKKVKSKSKDKPDETRPLISVTDLQRLQFKDAIIKKHRTDPFKTKLKGVDEYNWNIPKYDKSGYPEREKNPIETFDLKGFVKEFKKQQMISNPAVPPISPSFNSGFNNPFSGINIGNSITKEEQTTTNSNNKSFDVDELIRKIDNKIAQLEKEEKDNNLQNSVDYSVKDVNTKLSNSVSDNLNKIINPDTKDAVKVSSNIDKVLKSIEESNTTDDQFFDDFFFDE